MAFAIGLFVGLGVGCFVGIVMMALLAANGYREMEDEEQARLNNEIRNKDRNEF